MHDLYPGAKVRLGSGELATVVDPGEYHRRNALVARRADVQLPRGVLVELESGERRDVARAELTFVPPEHPCRGERDTAEFERIKGELEPLQMNSWRLIVREFLPASYESVALVLHPWERDGELVTWHEVARAMQCDLRALSALEGFDIGEFGMRGEGQLQRPMMQTLIDVLRDHTTTSDDVFFTVWEGWGGDQWEWFPGAAHVFLPHRGCWLLRGPIEGALAPPQKPAFEDDTLHPLLWWPADRAWAVHTDVDWRWTFVAGTEALITALESSPHLEVLRTTFDGPSSPG